MEKITGLLKIRVKRGIDLVVRDILTSDPYVVISMADQKCQTRVVKNNCNPEWNDELTLSITGPSVPINLAVYDKDTLTADDKMGEAKIDVQPYLDVIKKRLENLPTPTIIARIQPSGDNCLAEESSIVWKDGKIYQDMVLGLRNVKRGKVEIQLEWVHKLKTRVVKNNCNPEWNDELTLSITDPSIPICLTVYDKDTFTVDDKMGEAKIDIKPYLDAIEMRLQNLPTPTTIARVQPSKTNCLADESCIVWKDGKIYQDMMLRLANVETGEVEVQLEWIDLSGGSRHM
ncbi:hypothetical protein EUGRSUZ_G02165 [Eucalyptus grandis]|uniref:Uncharacterized protein n=2 Tax=Eucalyptus grandis TaxID=71139 RepID=A0ACC3K568_EUCGR|nr:hypothetical protein EUGRSUZ_G02165 [Eucalyptus grandis]